MENGNYGNAGFTPSDYVLARGMNVGGFGYGGYGGYGSGFANQSAVMHGIGYNRQQGENQADCTRAVLGNAMDSNARSFNQAETSRNFQRICDSVHNSDQLNSDRLRDIEREMNANAREQAKCCCDAKLEACKNTAEIIKETAKCCCDTQKLVFSENQKTRDMLNQNEIRRATDANNVNATVAPIVGAINQGNALLLQAIGNINCHHPFPAQS